MMESGEEEEETGKDVWCQPRLHNCEASAQITEIRRGRDRPGKKEDDDSNLAQGSGRSRGIASLHSLTHT